MKVLETLDFFLKTSVVAGAVGIFGCAAFAGTDLDPLTADGVLTIPSLTTVTIDDDNAAAFSALTGVVFTATSSTLAFSNTEVLNVNAALSGAKGKVTSGAGVKLNLLGNSPTFQGAFSFVDSTVTVSNRYALGKAGATVSSTNNNKANALYCLTFGGAGMTNDATVTCAGDHRFQKDNIHEKLVFTAELAAGPDSVHLHFGDCEMRGGYKSSGGSPQPYVIGGCDAWIGKLTFGGNLTFFDHADGPGRLHMTANNNLLSLAFTVPSKLTLVAEKTNCFYSTSTVGQFYLGSNPAATGGRAFDLNGFDQVIRTITKNNYSEALNRPEQITSAKPAVLRLDGISNTSRTAINEFTLPMQFHGKASFKLNIPAAATLHLSYGKSDSTETLEVARGTLDFTQNAGWGGTNVVVSGGTLNLNSQYSISNENARLVVSAGKIVLNAKTKVKSARIGDVELEPGAAYAKEDLPAELQQYVDGAAKLYVDYEEGQITYKTSVWKDGVAGGSISDPENWSDGKAPNFKDGGATLEFPAGVEAAVDGTISVYALRFLGDVGTTLSGSNGARIRIGAGGILSSNALGTAVGLVTNRIAVQLQTTSSDADTWRVYRGTALDLDCDILAGGSTTLTLDADKTGCFLLKGDNAGLTRPLKLVRGYYEAFTSTALGSPTRDTLVSDSKARFFFHCLTNDVPLKGNLANGDPATTDAISRLWCDSERGLVQNGLLTMDVGTSVNIGSLTIRGGFNGGNQTVSSVFTSSSGTGDVLPSTICDTPVNLAVGGALGLMLGTGKLTVSATGNDWVSCNIRGSQATLVCGAAGVMPPSRMITFGDRPEYPAGVLDLNGFNQTTPGMDHNLYNCARTYYKGARYGMVTSAVPARLTWSGVPSIWLDSTGASTINPTNSVRFRGEAALRVNSDYRHTIINAKSDTVGTLEILKGILTFAWGAGWSAATNVVVSGGTLRVEEESAPYAFGPHQGRSAAFLSVTGEGRVQIDGGQAAVYALSTDGETFLNPGVYGGSEAGLDAAHTLSCLSGRGTLKVRTNGTPNGIILIVR